MANSDQETARYVFLDAVAERVEFILGMNLEYIRGIEKCFLGTKTGEQCDKEMDRVRKGLSLEYASFHRHVFNNTMLSKMSHFFRLYEMQAWSYENDKPIKGLSLRGMGIYGWDNPLSQADSIVDSQMPELNYYEEDIKYFIGDASQKITERVKDEETNKESVKRFPYAYNVVGYMKKICNDFHNELRGAELETESRPLCNEFRLSYTEEEGFKFLEPQFVEKDDRFFFQMLNGRIHSMANDNQEHLLQKLYRSVSNRPYLAFATSAEPSDQELAQIFGTLKANAAEELKRARHQRKVAKGMDTASQLRLKRAQRRGASGSKINLGNPDVALDFMSYGPIAKNVLEDPNTHMENLKDNVEFAEVYGQLLEDYASRMGWKLAKDIGLAVGTSLACLAPIGKVFQGVKWLAKTIVVGKTEVTLGSILCFSITGAGWNTYFYKEASEIYDRTWRRLFSSKQGQTLLAEMEELSDAEFGLIMETLMWPVGILGLREAGVLARGVFSKKSVDLIKELSEQAR